MAYRYLGSSGLKVSEITYGNWLTHGSQVENDVAEKCVHAALDAGITTFDCADIYTGVEELIGGFLSTLGPSERLRVQVHTKCVPDRDSLASLDARQVAALVDRSLVRLGVERLDLVQLHWWDYDVPGYVEAARWLDRFLGLLLLVLSLPLWPLAAALAYRESGGRPLLGSETYLGNPPTSPSPPPPTPSPPLNTR